MTGLLLTIVGFRFNDPGQEPDAFVTDGEDFSQEWLSYLDRLTVKKFRRDECCWFMLEVLHASNIPLNQNLPNDSIRQTMGNDRQSSHSQMRESFLDIQTNAQK